MIDKSVIVNSIRELPTLPDAVARLSKMVRDSRSTASDFEKVIRPDPALTANLLKLANSAFFGFTRKIESVRQAVSLMGVKRVYELAAGGAFSGMIPDPLPGYQMKASDFWRHCIAVAILSEKLAQKLKIKAPDMTFTAGLLHDIGKLVIGKYVAEHENEILSKMKENSHLNFVAAEQNVIGSDHTDIGQILAEKWNLPSSVCQSIRWHHTPNECPEGVDQNLVDLVHTANNLAHILGFGADVGGLRRRVDEEVVKRLKITPEIIDTISALCIGEIEEMAKSMQSA